MTRQETIDEILCLKNEIEILAEKPLPRKRISRLVTAEEDPA